MVFSGIVSDGQKYRLQSAGYRRSVVAELEDGVTLIDGQSGTPFKVVGEALPLAPAKSDLPWSPENLRLCGCAREQLVQRDVNDCPYCDRRLPAAAGTSGDAG